MNRSRGAFQLVPMGIGGIAGLGACLVAALVGCHPDAAKPAQPPPAVTVAPVARQEIALYNEAVGNLDGYVNAEIRARALQPDASPH